MKISTHITELDAAAELAPAFDPNDAVAFVCANKELIEKAINIAKIFTNAKTDKALDNVLTAVGMLCK